MIYNNQQNLTLKVYFDKSYFFVGEYIKGNIEINLNSDTEISGITIQIIPEEYWKVKDGSEYKSNLVNNNNIVKYNLDLKTFKQYNYNNGKILLTSGISFIPFNFRFSENNFPSFEYPKPEFRAYIRYNFNVTIYSNFKIRNGSYYLCLKSRPYIGAEKILTKSINQPIKKWKIFNKGDTILKISIPEDNFKYDSICKLTIEIDNTKGKESTKESKIMLIRRINCKNYKGEVKYKDETNIVSERIRTVVKAGKKETFEYDITFKEKDTKKKFNYPIGQNPYNAEMDKIGFFMPTTHGRIISCDYEIKISLYFSCFVDYDHRPRIIMPVYIVHQLPMDYQLEIQEQIDFENCLKKSIIENNNNSIKKNYNYDKNDNYLNYNNNNNDDNKNFTCNNNIISKHYSENQDDDDELPSLEEIKKSKNYQNEINNNNINRVDINKCEINNYNSNNKILNINNNSNNNILNINNNSNNIFNINNYNSNNNNNSNKNNIININEIDINNNDEYNQTLLGESAPLPLERRDENENIFKNNNSYPIYNEDKFNKKENENENINKSNNIYPVYNENSLNKENGINNNNNIYNNNNNQNNIINNNQILNPNTTAREDSIDFSLFNN